MKKKMRVPPPWVLKALSGKLDIKRHTPSVLYMSEATESLRYHIFALDSVVIIQKLLSSQGGFLTYAIYHKNGIYMLKITQIYMCLII